MTVQTVTNPEILTKLPVYQQETEAELTRILDFWRLHTLDEKNGGFVGQIDNNGQVNYQAPKGGVLNARILWTFSAAYRHTHNPEYLRLADRAFAYIKNYFIDQEYGGVYWLVDAQGQPLNTRKQIYGLAFTIYGLSEYYRATNNAQAFQLCLELYEWIEKHSYDPEHGGYLEAFSREGNLLEDLRLSVKDRNDPKTMNTHLHILEAYANLYRIWPDKHLKQQLRNLLEVFLQHIIDPETGSMKLFMTKDWQPTADLISYGHDIEASWLMYEAAEILADPELIHRAEITAVKLAEAATKGLQPDGSLYHELNRAENLYDKHREWWVSAEAMVGFLNAYQLTLEDSFWEKSWNSWQFIQKYLLDKEKGEWIWGVLDDYSRMQSEDKVGFWKCPYHNARACLEVVNRCKKLLPKE